MKRSKLFTIIGSVCLMLVIAALPFMAACAAPAPAPAPTPTPVPTPTPAPVPAPEKVIEMKFATYYPVLHPMNYDCYNLWAKELDKRTNGRVRSVLFSGQSLAPIKENYDAVKSGMADLGDVWTHTVPGIFALSEMYHLPFIAPGASIAAQSIYRCTTEHPEMLAEFEKNFHLIAQHTSAIMNLHTTSKVGLVKTLEQQKGLLLGIANPNALEWFSKMGASPTQIDTGSAYLALDKGVIEGGVWPWAPLRSEKMTDFLTNHTVIDLCFLVANVLMNREKWESLPADVKEVIDEIGGINLSAWAGYTLTNGSMVDVQYMKNKGDQFYTLPPDEKARWAEKVYYSVQAWKDKVTEKGLTKDVDKLWSDIHKIVAAVSENPDPEQEWWGKDAVGRYGSPNRPGGWD